MSHALIGEIAGVLGILQIIPYVIDIFRGHTKPERATYFIWFIVDTVTITSYIAVGARTTIWVGLVYVFSGLLIFGLSIKYGMGGYSTFDIICLVLALIGLTLWVTSKNALLALYFSVFVATIGYLPTIKKAYFYPETENTLSWTITACTGILNFFALTSFTLTLAFPLISSAITSGLVAYLLLFPIAHARMKERRFLRKIHLLLSHPILLK
ncbi:MAG: hypothetical protein WA843_00855 [Candidatus Saccharimonadales bacterium]